MPDRIRTGDGATTPTLNDLLRLGEGYGWLEGGGVTRGKSGSDVVLDVEGGTVRVNGSLVDFSAGTVELFDGNPNYPRRDLVYVDVNGDLGFLQGEARERKPSDQTRFQTWSPAPPEAASIDGVVLAEVWVPADAAVSSDLDSEDIRDRRVADIGGFGFVPELSSDPDKSELSKSRLWRNTNAGEFRGYASDADKIVTFQTSDTQTFTGTSITTIESFEGDISANWSGSAAGNLEFGTPAVEGSASALWDIDPQPTAYSLPGDGLSAYPESGDTVGLAVYPTTQSGDATDGYDLAIAKPDAESYGDYRVRIDRLASELQVLRTDSGGTETELGSASFSDSLDTWYIMEIDYDGGGQGVHTARVWSANTGTSPATRDTILAEVNSPTQDTTHRARGVAISVEDAARTDYLFIES